MRFVVTGEWSRNRLLRLILGLFLVFMLLLWISNFILYFGKMDLTPSSVVGYYLGDETKFSQPRSLRGLAEIAHFHLFAMGILVLTLTHLLLFLPLRMGAKAALIVGTFAAALLEEGSGWLLRFVHPGFAWLKVISFVVLQALLGLLLIAIVSGIVRPERNAYRDAEES